MQKNKLVDGWKEVELGDIAEFINGRAFKPSEWEDKGKIIIRIQDLTGNIENPNFTTQTFDDRYLVKKGDLLISWSATLDAFIWNKEEGWLNQHIFKVVENKNLIYRKFLYYLVKNKIEDLKKETHGSTMKHITKGNFNSIKFFLPPIDAQKNIVSILERSESLKQKRDNADKLTKEYLQSVFYEMFGKLKLQSFSKDIFEIIDGDRGINYPHGDDFSNEGYCLFLNTGNVRENGFNFNNTMFITKEKDEQLRKGKAKINDIILTTRGTVGNVALYNHKIPYKNVRINSGMVLLRPNLKNINPIFLSFLIHMPIMQEQFKQSNSGTAQPQLPITNLKQLDILLPPIELQQEFASIVEQTEELKEKQKQSKEEINLLFDSLMKQAFNGELKI